jgi:hypothetical protein
MKELGFMTTIGEHDYVYKWEKGDILTDEQYREMEEKILKLIDTVQSKLKGKGVHFSFRTIRSL